MGFVQLPTKATSHTQWETTVDGVLYHVTLDAHNAPYSRNLLASICRQAGVTKKELFQAIDRKGHPRAKPVESQPSIG